MNVVVEKAGACRKKLRIEIPADKVQDEYKALVSTYAKAVRIPGFRKGKAPAQLVEKRFGKEIHQELKDRLVPQGYRDALAQEKIEPVAVLGVEDVDVHVGKPLSFEVTLDVPPEFKMPNYKGIKLKREKVEVKPDQVENSINEILRSRAKYIDVEGRPVEKNDLVQIDYLATLDGQPIEELSQETKGMGQSQDFWVHAGENAFLPEFEEGLLGLQPGENRDVSVTFADDFRLTELAGRTASYAVSVKSIRTQEIPELSEELTKELGVDSEEDLRTRIEEDLLSMAESSEKGRLKSEIIKHLMGKTKMDLPTSVVEEETRSVIYDMVRENSMRGISQDQIESQKGELFEAAGQSAAEKVKSRYLLSRIADEEDINVVEAEVTERLQQMGLQYGMPAEAVREQMQKNNQLDNVREQIRIDKTLDFLLEEAKVTG